MSAPLAVMVCVKPVPMVAPVGAIVTTGIVLMVTVTTLLLYDCPPPVATLLK